MLRFLTLEMNALIGRLAVRHIGEFILEHLMLVRGTGIDHYFLSVQVKQSLLYGCVQC